RDNDGTVCAYGYTREDQHWMILPGLACFQFGKHVDDITAMVAQDAPLEMVQDAFYRSILPMVLQVRGREVLHASAVRTACGVVALWAVSETGKSTIAYGLSRRGYQLWADDAVAIDVAGPIITAIQLPFSIRLRPASASYFAVESPGHAPLERI